MNLIKVSLLNSIAVAIKIVIALVLNKVLAIYVGPGGYAVIGQFQNFISIVTNLSGSLLNTGIAKLTAEHYNDQPKQYEVWKTAIKLSLITSLIFGMSLIFFRNTISEWIFQDINKSSIFILLAFFLPSIAVNNIILAIINGKKEIAIYVLANIIGSLVSLLVVYILTISLGLYGTLIAFVIHPAVGLVSTFLLVVYRDWFKVSLLYGKINQVALKELTRFGIMGVTSALVGPISYILIRDLLISNHGLVDTGY